MSKHFNVDASIQVHDAAPRGIQVRPHDKHGAHISIHNGGGPSGNISAFLTYEEALEFALEVLHVIRQR